MKNKKLTYILIPAAAIIWGLVIYRIFAALNSQPEILPYTNIPEFKEDTFTVTDTFTLVADYPDPFLKNLRYRKASVTKKTKSTVKKKITKKPAENKNVIWPKIQYQGLVQRKNNEQRVGLILINGKTYLVKNSKVVEKIKIIHLYNDSVSLELGNSFKTIRK